jgi:xanthine dehydrogenase accessory factor
VLGYLAERGLDREQLGRVHVPAGLDLGRTTHQEIAVAVLAELVQLRASGALAAPAAAGDEAVPGRATRADAVDPVCGMTAAAGSSGRPLTYDGQTYHFCSARCRREFERDPAAHARKETRC